MKQYSCSKWYILHFEQFKTSTAIVNVIVKIKINGAIVPKMCDFLNKWIVEIILLYARKPVETP